MSQLTTHVLDTSVGKPAAEIEVILEQKIQAEWKHVARGITNQDGRIPDLLSPGKKLDPGVYRLHFDTDAYFHDRQIHSFYPRVTVEFVVRDEAHYHVPLLLSPYGYSTYRGS